MPALSHKSITEFLESADLQTPSVVGLMILKCVSCPDWSLEQLTSIVRTDQAIAAKLAQAATKQMGNRQPASIEESIMWVGSKTFVRIALSAFLKQSSHSEQSPSAVWRKRYWHRSIIQATTASVLATAVGDNAGRFFLTGLMFNVGTMALLQTHPKEYATLLSHHETSPIELRQAEMRLFGSTQLALSRALVRKWGIHQSVADALDEHYASAVSLLTEPLESDETLRLTAACYIGSQVAALYDGESPSNGSIVIESLTRKYFQQDFDFVLQQTADELSQTGAFLDIDYNRLKSPAALKTQAEDEFSSFLTDGGFRPDSVFNFSP